MRSTDKDSSVTLRDGIRVQTRVNGETVQDGRTDGMVDTVGDTLAHTSRTFTLPPGDLLATGHRASPPATTPEAQAEPPGILPPPSGAG